MNDGIVSTILARCKRCYSCIRECPAQAIKVINGQAAVLYDRCIVCGHCVKVCSQNAKRIASDIEKVQKEILTRTKTIAIVAPSFAASFPNDYLKLPSALRKLGFSKVVEAAFGADLISGLYLKVFESEAKETIISSACPAVINYIEKYHTDLVPSLAKIVSPMIAMGRYLKSTLGSDYKIVFIGPCIAKKQEYMDEEVCGAIDAVLTFTEIKRMFINGGIDFAGLEETNFDPPHANMGKSFPLAGGLLKTATISGDILEKEIIAVEGKKKVTELIDEISDNNIKAKFVDILFCEGCISGPAIDSNLNYYSRREKVINFIEEKINSIDKQIWKSNLYNSRKINFYRNFSAKSQKRPYPSEERIKEILTETNKFKAQDELNCGACGYNTCREYAIAIAKDLAEKEMCLPYLIDELGKAYNNLSNTQEQLRTAEKLASIGQLAAGVAHEINNPLGTIILYSSLLKKQLSRIQESGQNTEDLDLIMDEANRCKNIVANLLNFARQGKLNLTKVELSLLLEEIVKTIKVNPLYENIEMNIDGQISSSVIDGDEDQLKQVFLNIINNACEALGELEKDCRKTLAIKLKWENDFLVTEITDNGPGIPKDNFAKVFTPFFTTKKIGKGTGLGLAITYGIVKMHQGFISFQSEQGKGTTFVVKLPKENKTQIINLN
ncbi:MAG: [Fe-Fe] hydrogenase large subunit C-terminal domain-containing protein [Ignavibacteriaceae bacterium]|nr:[Fe-Fe] hydrogenase large subunit C-terminal domain-containing protein [Ignavibacteriaceae bacterium]